MNEQQTDSTTGFIAEICLEKDSRTLLVQCDDGQEEVLTAVTLRHAARDVKTRRELQLQVSLDVPDDITITHIEAMGTTGVNIQFSDGHQKAIYPYAYLMQLCNFS